MLVLRTAVGVIAIDVVLWLLVNDKPLIGLIVAAAAFRFVAGRGRNRARSRDVWVGRLLEAKPGLGSPGSDSGSRVRID
jgi:hypothetical protein